MPDKKGRFSGRETIFVERYAATGDAIYAAEKAGYSSVRQAASQNLNNPLIASECRRRVQEQLLTDILPAASRRHAALLADERTTGQVLIRAIDLAYKHGFAPNLDTGGDQPHSAMTREEIDRRIKQLEAERRPLIDHDGAETVDVEEELVNAFD